MIERQRAFLEELTALCGRHGVRIDSLEWVTAFFVRDFDAEVLEKGYSPNTRDYNDCRNSHVIEIDHVEANSYQLRGDVPVMTGAAE